MKLARKIRRQNEKKQRKLFSKALRTVSKRFEMLGEHCRACGKDFDTTNPDHIEHWKIYVQGDDPRIVCPDCNDEILRLQKEMYESENVDPENTNEVQSNER